MYHVIPRGSGKSVSNYFADLKYLYDNGKISYEDYISMVAVAKTLLLHEDEEEVLKWMKEKLKNQDESRN